ncbi:MAG: DUF6167 family protein [Antricoccus sp.]
MRRIFWLAMGITIGVLAVRKMTKAVESLRPDSLATKTGNALAEFGVGLRGFTDEVRLSMQQREVELRDSVGFDGVLGAKPADFPK